MAQTIALRERVGSPSAVGSVVALALVAALATVADIVVGTGAWFFAIVGVVVLIAIVGRPELGIAAFLATFLTDLRFGPAALQGTGFLTPNNVLGMMFLVLLAHRIYVSGDWSFILTRELLVLAFIAGCYYASAALNGPEPRLLEMIGGLAEKPDSSRLFINRVAFVVFFVSFIRSAWHIRLVYLLAIAMMVVTTVLGVQSTLQGSGIGAGGYRASAQQAVIGAAWNPNRLAMLATISVGALWYAFQQARSLWSRGGILVILPVLVLAVFMTASRSGLLALIVCIGFIVVDEGISIRKILGVALAGAAALALVLRFVPDKSLERITNLPGVQGSDTGVGASSLERRAYTFEIGYEMVRDNPFLGVGVGNWEITRFLKDPSHATAAPHSSFILAMAEGGGFCVLAYLLVFWQTWQNLTVANRLIPSTGRLQGVLWIVRGCRAGLITLVVFSAFADLWQFIIVFWLIGLGVVLRRYAEQNYSYAAA